MDTAARSVDTPAAGQPRRATGRGDVRAVAAGRYADRSDEPGREAQLRAVGGPIGVRIQGVDVARALAIIGMIAVHVGPTNGTDVVGRLYALPYGRASLLFVLVAGVGVTLLARSRRATLAGARVTLLWRAALLLPAGLALQRLDHGANVILQAYALLFLIAVAALALSSRWLLSLSALAFATGPIVYWWGQARSPHLYDRTNGDLTDTLPDVLHALVLSGPYPLVTWMAPLLFGMWLGRQDLSRRSLQRRLVLIGATVGIGSVVAAEVMTARAGPAAEETTSLWYLTIAVPHSQMPLWLIGSTGAAAAVLGIALWMTPLVDRWLWPLVATGQLALTVYVAHLVSLHIAPETLRSDAVGNAALIVIASVAAAMVFATAWRARFRHGPLELALRPPSRLSSPD